MMVPEPTEAMVAAATDQLTDFTDGVVHWGDLSPATAAWWIIEAGFAAAPPEWLLRAALTEDEIKTILGYGVAPDGLIGQINEKFRRALRGGTDDV